MVCCCVAGWLSMLEMLLFNGPLFDAHEGILDWTRDIATLVDAFLLVALLAIARNRPRLIRPVGYSTVACCTGIVGHILCAAGVLAVGGGCLAVGCIAVGIAVSSLTSVWALVLWLLACSALELRRACLCLTGSGIAALPVGYTLNMWAPYSVLAVADTVCAVGAIALCLPYTRAAFRRIVAGNTPAEQALLNPRTVLPLSHAFYVYIFGFSLAYGFALRCESMASSTIMSVAMLATLVAVTVYAWRVSEKPRADVLFTAAFAAVAVGFMLVLMGDARISGVAAALLVAGYLCLQLLVWFAVIAAAGRNILDAIPTICWGTAVGYLGICAGVALWALPNILLAPVLDDLLLVQGLIVTAVFSALLLFALATRRSFSFDATIEGIAPDAPQVEVRYVETVDECCSIAAERFGLTAREFEVLRLLARGNNTSHMQRELGIGANTVKYHVKNVYAKMGVHSQQQLIDCVGALERSHFVSR